MDFVSYSNAELDELLYQGRREGMLAVAEYIRHELDGIQQERKMIYHGSGYDNHLMQRDYMIRLDARESGYIHILAFIDGRIQP